MRSFRPCHAFLWLRGENPAVAVRFFLEFLFQASTGPFLPFGEHFLLNLTQGAWSLLMTIHSPFWLLYCFTLFALTEEPNSSKSLSITVGVSRCALVTIAGHPGVDIPKGTLNS